MPRTAWARADALGGWPRALQQAPRLGRDAFAADLVAREALHRSAGRRGPAASGRWQPLCPPARRRQRGRRRAPGDRVRLFGDGQQAVGKTPADPDVRDAGRLEATLISARVKARRIESSPSSTLTRERNSRGRRRGRRGRARGRVEVVHDQGAPRHAKSARSTRATSGASKWCRNSEAVTTSKLPPGRERPHVGHHRRRPRGPAARGAASRRPRPPGPPLAAREKAGRSAEPQPTSRRRGRGRARWGRRFEHAALGLRASGSRSGGRRGSDRLFSRHARVEQLRVGRARGRSIIPKVRGTRASANSAPKPGPKAPRTPRSPGRAPCRRISSSTNSTVTELMLPCSFRTASVGARSGEAPAARPSPRSSADRRGGGSSGRCPAAQPPRARKASTTGTTGVNERGQAAIEDDLQAWLPSWKPIRWVVRGRRRSRRRGHAPAPARRRAGGARPPSLRGAAVAKDRG